MRIDKSKGIPYVFDLFNTLKIEYVDNWPPLSPDINPIEKMWSLTQTELDKILLDILSLKMKLNYSLLLKELGKISITKLLSIYTTISSKVVN